MIYVCIPSHNEAPTVGLLLWKIRQVFAAFPREYQLLVLDDASDDTTGEVLEPYARVLPLTVLRHAERRGYAASVEALLRKAVDLTDRPKRDAAILMHADFAHNPQVIPDLVRRLESGADLVVAEAATRGRAVPRAPARAPAWAGAAPGRGHGAGSEGPRVRVRLRPAGRATQRDPEPERPAARDRWLGGQRRALLARRPLLPPGRDRALGRAARPPEPPVTHRAVGHRELRSGPHGGRSGRRRCRREPLEPTARREVEAGGVVMKGLLLAGRPAPGRDPRAPRPRRSRAIPGPSARRLPTAPSSACSRSARARSRWRAWTRCAAPNRSASGSGCRARRSSTRWTTCWSRTWARAISSPDGSCRTSSRTTSRRIGTYEIYPDSGFFRETRQARGTSRRRPTRSTTRRSSTSFG